ncbi:RNA polymerase subunit sigma, partial [Turicibacter sanguinis]|nr:RNA polymerase subunit sigma [Turicibacter sanguinis]
HNYNEIAIILNLSPKKIDNALSRCKSKLKNLNKMNSSIGESF